MPEQKTFYTCGVDWQHELGETITRLYKTEEAARKWFSCFPKCGLVRLEVTAHWIEPQNLEGLQTIQENQKDEK